MPALFDMPLEQLQAYRGTNPRPVDFDAYWAKALADLAAVDAKVALVEAEFQMPQAKCYHLYFDGIGGARIHAKWIVPTGTSRPVPAVLRFHGYSGQSGDWAELLPYAAMGWSVAALDCRGQAGLSEDRGIAAGPTWSGHIIRGLLEGPESLYYRGVFLDTVRLAQIVMAHEAVDETRVSTTGHSQGGALSLVCAALEPRIQKVAAQCPFLCDFQRVWQLDLLKDAYEELSYFFRRFDPLHERESEIWTRLGYIDVQHLSDRIRAQTLFVVGLMDTVCPPSTQFAAYNRIEAEKSMLLYPEFRHEPYLGAADKILRFLTWDG